MTSTAIAVVVVVVYSFIEIRNNKGSMNGIKLWDIRHIPNLLTKLVFAYSATYLYPHIESTMKKKSKWKFSLSLSMGFIFICYIIISITGLLAFKEHIKAPVYANLDPKSPAIILILILMVIHFLFATPIFLCTIALDLESRFDISIEKRGALKEFLLRICVRLPIILSLTILSICVDDFEFASDLIGAVPKTFLVIIMPCLCYLKLHGIKGHPIYRYILIFLLLALGIICSFYGTYDAFVSYFERKRSKI